MKVKNILMLMCGLLATSFMSCSDDDNQQEPTKMAELKEGQIVQRELKIGNKGRIYVEDEIINYGDEEIPVLFSVNKKFEMSDDDYEGLMFVLQKDSLEKFFQRWAETHNLSFVSAEDKADVASHIYDYFFHSELDLALFVELINSGFSVQDLKTAVQTSRSNQLPANDILYMLYREQSQNQNLSKGTAKDIIGIIEGIIDLYNVWKDFFERNQPIAEAVEGVCSFLNGEDTDANNYTLGEYFISPDYALSYWVSGIWHAQLTYIVEGYKGTHPVYDGLYVPKCRIRTTYLNVDGPSFIGSGSYQFSPIVNISDDFNKPIPQANGMVQVVYGDCCCFRYFSYMNFSVDGKNGYRQISFSDGK